MSHQRKQDEFWEDWKRNIVMHDEKRNERLNWTLTQMKKRDITRVIDIGCGPGWHTKLLHDAGYQVTGSDISLSAIELAREHFPKIPFIVGPLELLGAVHYDALVCLAVFGMLEDDEKAMEILSKVADWGYFAFMTWNDHPLHTSMFDVPKVVKLVEKHGSISTLEETPRFIMVEADFREKND